MSIKVKFDTILGRLRERDGDNGGGTPTPDATSHFTVSTSPAANVSYMADAESCPGLTVVVTTRFDGVLVDADTTPSGWTRTAKGTYQRYIATPGTVAAQAWSYTPGGIYGSQTVTKSSQARSLAVVYPAYWGLHPSNDAAADITTVVAALAQQHRATANVNNTLEVPNPTGDDCYLWIVTHNAATAAPAATPGISMVWEPVTGKTFGSPLANWDMTGYKAYVSKYSAKAGAAFGTINLTINL